MFVLKSPDFEYSCKYYFCYQNRKKTRFLLEILNSSDYLFHCKKIDENSRYCEYMIVFMSFDTDIARSMFQILFLSHKFDCL